MTAPWQLWVLWGLFIGVGTGAMALVLGAIVANRWFSSHRGLVTGLFSAANATGQLSFLPVIAALAEGPGWRWAAGSVALVSLALVPLGYADGIPRCLSGGKLRAIVRGQYAQGIGRICMDQLMLDVTGIEDVRVGTRWCSSAARGTVSSTQRSWRRTPAPLPTSCSAAWAPGWRGCR